MPQSEDLTDVPRPSHRAATSGYPLGFAKSQWGLRDRLLSLHAAAISRAPGE